MNSRPQTSHVIIGVNISVISVNIGAISATGIPIQINSERIIHLDEFRFPQAVFCGRVPNHIPSESTAAIVL